MKKYIIIFLAIGIVVNSFAQIGKKHNYWDVGGYSEGLATAIYAEGYGYINKDKILVISLSNLGGGIGEGKAFSEGYAAVNKWNKKYDAPSEPNEWGYINKEGKIVVSPKYLYAGSFHEGLALVRLKGKGYGFINPKGQKIIPFKYNNAEDFSDGRAAVKLSGKWGFIDKKGKNITPFKYDNEGFYSGRMRVSVNGKWGFIDKYGDEVIPLIYDYVEDFYEEGKTNGSSSTHKKGCAFVSLNGKYFHIDINGKVDIWR